MIQGMTFVSGLHMRSYKALRTLQEKGRQEHSL